jgi:uncharacterized membrane protein
MLLLGFILVGKDCGIKTVIGTATLSGTMLLLEKVVPLSAPLTNQPFLELLYAVILPAVGSAILFILAFILSGRKALLRLCKSFLWVSGGFVIIVAALGIYAAVDFTGFWVSFHHVFFSNNLWLLDPAKSILIQLVAEQFFSDLVARIIIRFVSMFAALNIAAAVGAHFIRKNNVKKAAEA